MPRDLVLPAMRFDLTSFGELVSDPSRVAMLLALMDDCARPATELAALADVTPQTASFHLARLVSGGLLRVDAVGRHRYYRLAGHSVADALEAIALLSKAGPNVAAPAHVREKSLARDPARRALAYARTCYTHLAGEVGVAWLTALERARFVALREGHVVLTRRGTTWLASTGLVVDSTPPGKPCLDWTERRNHLGGPLGALLTKHLFHLNWIARPARRGREAHGSAARGVRVTTLGQRALIEHLALPPSLFTTPRG